jgi:hypothetical protein
MYMKQSAFSRIIFQIMNFILYMDPTILKFQEREI